MVDGEADGAFDAHLGPKDLDAGGAEGVSAGEDCR
jgi:hypothetical protein